MYHLLNLLDFLCHLALTSLLRGLWSRLGIHHIIPPSETARVVADEALMMNVVVLSSSPEGNEVVQAPWEIVATVSIDSLEETCGDPEVHSKDVEIAGEQAPENWHKNSSSTKNHGFNRGGIFGSESERRGILVMDLVDVLVEEAVVEDAVHPVMPCILQHEKDCDLEADCLP